MPPGDRKLGSTVPRDVRERVRAGYIPHEDAERLAAKIEEFHERLDTVEMRTTKLQEMLGSHSHPQFANHDDVGKMNQHLKEIDEAVSDMQGVVYELDEERLARRHAEFMKVRRQCIVAAAVVWASALVMLFLT